MRHAWLVVLLLAGCLRGGGEPPWTEVRGPPCSGPAYDRAPLALDAFTAILPLGHLNPPEHATPSDHVYFVYSRTPDSSGTPTVDVVAPGDLRITSMSRTTMERDGAVVNEDYSLDYAACGPITGRFGHLSDLSAELSAAAGNVWTNCNRFGDPQRGVEYEMCNAYPDIPVSSGTKLGTAGGKMAAALDMWTYDDEAEPLAYADPGRYRPMQLQVVCPVDHFEESVREELRARFGDEQKRRAVEPLCGEVNQDKPGSAQGNWFVGDVEADSPESWRHSVALVHDNVDGVTGAISVGGPLPAGRWSFTPQHEGAVNRDFDEVVPGGLYCYESGTDRFVLELKDARHLRLERQTGGCGGSVAFVEPTSFER